MTLKEWLNDRLKFSKQLHEILIYTIPMINVLIMANWITTKSLPNPEKIIASPDPKWRLAGGSLNQPLVERICLSASWLSAWIGLVVVIHTTCPVTHKIGAFYLFFFLIKINMHIEENQSFFFIFSIFLAGCLMIKLPAGFALIGISLYFFVQKLSRWLVYSVCH